LGIGSEVDKVNIVVAAKMVLLVVQTAVTHLIGASNFAAKGRKVRTVDIASPNFTEAIMNVWS
jgi:hypothetical protein